MRSSSALSQPNTRPPALIRIDEFHTCLLKRALQCLQDGSARFRGAALELPQGDLADLGRSSEVALRPIEKRAGGTTLRWGHWLLISYLLFLVNYVVLR
jgi:hypothetical protein